MQLHIEYCGSTAYATLKTLSSCSKHFAVQGSSASAINSGHSVNKTTGCGGHLSFTMNLHCSYTSPRSSSLWMVAAHKFSDTQHRNGHSQMDCTVAHLVNSCCPTSVTSPLVVTAKNSGKLQTLMYKPILFVTGTHTLSTTCSTAGS